MRTDTFTKDDLSTLMKQEGELCVSLHLPTHHVTTEIQQDKIRFKNLLRQAKETLGDLESGGQDLLNLVAVETFANGGTVYLAGPEEVPGGGLLAALFRY